MKKLIIGATLFLLLIAIGCSRTGNTISNQTGAPSTFTTYAGVRFKPASKRIKSIESAYHAVPKERSNRVDIGTPPPTMTPCPKRAEWLEQMRRQQMTQSVNPSLNRDVVCADPPIWEQHFTQIFRRNRKNISKRPRVKVINNRRTLGSFRERADKDDCGAKNCLEVIVICHDDTSASDGPVLRTYQLQDYAASAKNLFLAPHAKGLNDTWCDYWLQDGSAATENILNTAQTLGFLIVPCRVERIIDCMDKVSDILDILSDFADPFFDIYTYIDQTDKIQDYIRDTYADIDAKFAGLRGKWTEEGLRYYDARYDAGIVCERKFCPTYRREAFSLYYDSPSYGIASPCGKSFTIICVGEPE